MDPRRWLHWTPNGPGRMTCRHCGKNVSTNALARAAHEKACLGSHAARLAAEQKKGK